MNPKASLLRGLSVVCLVLCLISFIYGLIYIILSPGDAPFHNLFGVLFLIAMAASILLAYLNDIWDVTRRVKICGSVFLIFMLIALPAMSIGQMASSNAYDPTNASLIYFLVVYPAFLGTFVIGAIQAWLTFSSGAQLLGRGSRWVVKGRPGQPPRIMRVLHVIVIILMILGVFLVYILLTDYLGMTQVLVSQNALFMAFFFLALAALDQKIITTPGTPGRYITGAMGLVMFFLFMLPLILMPQAVEDAEMAYADAFGSQWRQEIAPEHEEHFRPYRLSIPAYFAGVLTTDYEYERDNIYYQGTEGVDEGIELRYDVYMPPETDDTLPGEDSTIIRIHGGAWMAGSKGAANMMQMNKYFASQGYTVFDIQYGLTDRVNLTDLAEMYDFMSFLSDSRLVADLSLIGSPESVTGSFTLDDMIRHIGIFTYYLEDNADRYDANLDSVFFSGGSAGGHLSTATALAIHHGTYDDIFNPEIEVSGYVPFYPGNQADEILEAIGGSEEWLDVEQLVLHDSPPCLIYQGTSDGMVPPEVARSFYESYRAAGNEKCGVIYLPLAAHASDFQFPGYYNQLFLYYMERFMAKHG